MIKSRGDHFRFGLVFIKKITKLKFFYLKIPKPVQTGLARFFSLARFFLVFFGFGSVQFFQFQTYETEPVGFFKILIGFFHGSVFLLFFSVFSVFWFFCSPLIKRSFVFAF